MKHSRQKLSENLLSTTSRHETQSSSSIFSQVPGKSLARFLCVSKYLASILRRSDFTELFLTKPLNRPRVLFTIKAKDKLFFYYSPQPHNPVDNSCLVVTPYHTSIPEYIPCDVSSTVCGLVLLQGWNRKVRVICNLATEQLLTLPKVFLKEKNLPKVLNPPKRRHMVAGMYLGYDHIGKQTKVLCMTSSDYERPNTHQVLTLESGKRVWRKVEDKFHFVKGSRIRGEICINGVLYFGASFGQSSRIVCFDVTSEKFSFIKTDEDMALGYPCSTLFNYKGKLGIHHRDLNNLVCDEELVLWVIEDAGNHKWSKHSYVLSSPLEYEIVKYNRFVGMTSTGEVVWTKYNERSNLFYLSFYSLESKTFKRVYIQGLEEFKCSFITRGIFLDYVEKFI
ncbi:hypothetical protein N665_0030s0006 [Sinapis alba]|nr:hypothetical protein N665_0030s0006 [Sinapis alba]